MSFLWPELLWGLVLVPALVAAYLWLLRRRKRAAVRYASLSMVRQALRPGAAWRRHLPPMLFLLSVALLLVAVARPTATVTLPSRHETVILAMDISGSMRATDVQPSRIKAAQAAAREFVSAHPRHTRIGVVAFAGSAALVQPPTSNREDVLGAIERFELQRATAIGSGILMSLKAIFPDMEIDLRSSSLRRDRTSDSLRGAPLDASREAAKPAFTPVPPGSYTSAAVILLTDGQSNVGPDPVEAARMAAERGVRVFTVGVGTAEGETLRFEGWSMRVRLDEETLKTIADLTRGEYFYASNAADLSTIYRTLTSRLVLETQETEITALFAAAAAALAVLAAGLSVFWFNRLL
ncbi:MAG: VWA domain-containing protein [Desulfobacterales bacterium]|jgi:Ca-activated chloride channel family protein|nr:VWA domain-containing protein [Desulfobacterales bacterium]